MEGQLSRSAVSIGRKRRGRRQTRNSRLVAPTPSLNTNTRDTRGWPPSHVSSGSRLARASGAHTLVLTGELTRRSAHALEVEIE